MIDGSWKDDIVCDCPVSDAWRCAYQRCSPAISCACSCHDYIRRRRGFEPFMTTFTGRFVNPLNVRAEDVCEADVAHHLALINRFNGATRQPITVAQHAVYVSRLLDGTGWEWVGLHHDDAEAYLGDMTKWIKESPEMETYRAAEDRAQLACYEAAGIDPSFYVPFPRMKHPLVEAADKLMLRFEGAAGFGGKTWLRHLEKITHLGYTPLTPDERARIGAWKPWSWRAAREAYLVRARELRADGRNSPMLSAV